MAVTKGKYSTHKKQLTPSPRRKIVHFPQAQGKLVESVSFSADPNYHNISINFQDQTCLNFVIEAGFTLETDYSDWKSGNQQVIRRWRTSGYR